MRISDWSADVCSSYLHDPSGVMYGVDGFLNHVDVIPLLTALLGIAISGGMFVVPLYAFLTTTVPKDQTARTVAANNIVNSGAMVAGSLLAMGLGFAGVGVVDQLLMRAAMCLISAWLAVNLHRACDCAAFGVVGCVSHPHCGEARGGGQRE